MNVGLIITYYDRICAEAEAACCNILRDETFSTLHSLLWYLVFGCAILSPFDGSFIEIGSD